jgi:hypothetical protein
MVREPTAFNREAEIGAISRGFKALSGVAQDEECDRRSVRGHVRAWRTAGQRLHSNRDRRWGVRLVRKMSSKPVTRRSM